MSIIDFPTGKIAQPTKYGIEAQQILIGYMLADHEAFITVRSVVRPEHFEARFRSAVRFTLEFENKFGVMPTPEHFKAKAGAYEPSPSTAVSDGHRKWFLDEYAGFARHKAVELSALDALDYIEKGQYDDWAATVAEANKLSVGAIADRFELHTESDILEMPVRGWLLDELIPSESLTVLYSPPAQCKSFLALSMALSLAHGLPWRGYQQEPKSVVYIAAEGASGLSVRLDAWRKLCGVTAVSKQFVVITSPINLMDADGSVKPLVDQLLRRREATGIGTDLVVVDTLGRSSSIKLRPASVSKLS